MLAWAAARVAAAGGGGGGGLRGAAAASAQPPASLRDPALATSHFMLHLLCALAPRLVDWGLVVPLPCAGAGDRAANARYALSVARRYGAAVFLSHQDVLEVNARALFVLLARIMLASRGAC